MVGDKLDLLELMRKTIEICMPNFRHYYKMVRKAKIVEAYPSNGSYYADVQPLRNDETDDPNEPMIPKVALPVIWAGPERGVICPPEPGTLCDLSYYDGDPNYPVISNLRWQTANPDAPHAELKEFVIQLEKDVELRIDKDKNIISLTPSNWTVEIGGEAIIKAEGLVSLESASQIILVAPIIVQKGNVTAGGSDGGEATIIENANRIQNGDLVVNGNVIVSGHLAAAGGITGCD